MLVIKYSVLKEEIRFYLGQILNSDISKSKEVTFKNSQPLIKIQAEKEVLRQPLETAVNNKLLFENSAEEGLNRFVKNEEVQNTVTNSEVPDTVGPINSEEN